ncbi:hypothetical protein [Tunturiibacter lichenicola]|uniref:hypothetical protein n=1 Tax=Tunturiibacter lichenicola TaxID=2051959 RepID=UPI0021B18AB9|nr:hypothetical protein [Edaphobacter lichenicola]
MSATARAAAGILLLTCSGLASASQAGDTPKTDSKSAAAEVSFQFDRPGLEVPHFKLRIQEDGAGTYQADQAEMAATQTSNRGQAAQHIDRPIKLTPGTVAKIFKGARSLNHFDTECASKAKNIADTGKKILTYSGSDGSGTCTYNYSENKNVDTLTNTFLAIAYTMDEGRKLEFLHRYDRLGLDAEMAYLSQEVQEGRALELGTISPTLASIADDTALIQRVRLKASKMLEQSAAENH